MLLTVPAFAGPADLVVFESPALEQAVCDFSGLTPGTITEADMATVTFVYLEYTEIAPAPEPISLQGLQYATTLDTLILVDCGVTDLGPLSALTSLTYLQVTNNDITDITPVAGLINLTYLELNYNPITNIVPVAGLTSLEYLWMEGCNVSDISPVATLTNLKGLAFQDDVRAISAVAGLTHMEDLYIVGNYLDLSAGSPAASILSAVPGYPGSVRATPQKTALVGTVTSGGSAVPGVTVTLGALPPVTTAADGTYVIDVPAPGAHTVTFARAGYTGASMGVTIVDGETETQDAVLAPSAVVSTPASSLWSLALIAALGLVAVPTVRRWRFSA